MPLLYHAYVYLEFLILACTIYILAPVVSFPLWYFYLYGIHIAPFVILSKDFGNFLNFIFTENKTVSDRTADAVEKYINNQKNK